MHDPDAENCIVVYMREMCEKVPTTVETAEFVGYITSSFCGKMDQEYGKGTSQRL